MDVLRVPGGSSGDAIGVPDRSPAGPWEALQDPHGVRHQPSTAAAKIDKIVKLIAKTGGGDFGWPKLAALLGFHQVPFRILTRTS